MNVKLIVTISTAAAAGVVAGTAKVVDMLRTNIYDKEGYNKKGYNKAGYDRKGYNSYGYNRAGYDRDGYNKDGYNSAGYDRDGYDREGRDKSGYDRDGYDRYGYNRNGYNRGGYTYASTIDLIEKMKKRFKKASLAYKNKEYDYTAEYCRKIIENIYKYYASSYFGCGANESFSNCINICVRNGFLSNEQKHKIYETRKYGNLDTHEFTDGVVNQAYFVLKTTQEELEIFKKRVMKTKNAA